MHKYFLILPFVVSAAILFGCAQQHEPPPSSEPKDLFVLMPDQDGKVGQITISNTAGRTTLTKAHESAVVTSHYMPARTEILSKQEIRKDFHDTIEAIPGIADHFILFFTTGTTQLTKESREQLPLILKKIKERFPCEISIIGHADTQASGEYNLKLSLQRAIQVKDQLLAIGVPRKLLEVSSHGENNPMIQTADNVAEPRNRRVEIFIR